MRKVSVFRYELGLLLSDLVFSYGFETYFIALKALIRMFENRFLKRIFGPKRERKKEWALFCRQTRL
jgi:hypothetical protein